MDEAGLPALLDAIRHMHGCEAEWIESVPVCETVNDAVWEGEVQTFRLLKHPTAQRAYVWSHEVDQGGMRKFHAVLRMGPVTGPVEAVRASAAVEWRRRTGA